MSKKNFIIMGIIFALSYYCFMTTWAQDAAPTSQTVQKTEQVSNFQSKTTFWGLVKKGGIYMVPLGFLLIATIGLTIYGFIATQEKRMLQSHLMPGIQNSLESLNIQANESEKGHAQHLVRGDSPAPGVEIGPAPNRDLPALQHRIEILQGNPQM